MKTVIWNTKPRYDSHHILGMEPVPSGTVRREEWQDVFAGFAYEEISGWTTYAHLVPLYCPFQFLDGPYSNGNWVFRTEFQEWCAWRRGGSINMRHRGGMRVCALWERDETAPDANDWTREWNKWIRSEPKAIIL